MTETDFDRNDGTIRICPILNSAPEFISLDYWTQSARAWEGIDAEAPLSEKPWAVLEVSLDVTLGSALDAACAAWGFSAGPDQTRYSGKSTYAHVGFVGAGEDEGRISRTQSYEWPFKYSIVREDGTQVMADVHELTYRELLVASALGLIDGDVTRPIIQPSVPQDNAPALAEAARIATGVARATYMYADEFFGHAKNVIRLIDADAPGIHRRADEIVDDGARLSGGYQFLKWIQTRLRHT